MYTVFNSSAPELDIQILAHPLHKMCIFYNQKS